jgi:hypothetical protein
MKQILKEEVKCFKHGNAGEVKINRVALKKYRGKRLIVKVFIK